MHFAIYVSRGGTWDNLETKADPLNKWNIVEDVCRVGHRLAKEEPWMSL